jgi:hypothetical protein
MISDANAKAAPSQTIGDLGAANMTTAPTTAQTLKRLLKIRSTTLDRVAPAKSDQAPMLMLPEGFADSMPRDRVYRFDPTFFPIPATSGASWR